MARNSVQFQKGLSDRRFHELYGTEELCRAALFAWRWPKGVRLPPLRRRRLQRDPHARPAAMPELPPPGLADRRHHLPPHPPAAHRLVPGDAPDRPVQERHLQPGAVAPAGGQLRHRLEAPPQADAGDAGARGRAALGRRRQARGDRRRLSRRQPLRRQARPGRAGENPLRGRRRDRPRRQAAPPQLAPVKGFRKAEIRRLTQRVIAPGSTVVSDGLSCFTVIAETGSTHHAMKTGSGPQAAKWQAFTWVNTSLGNVKNSIRGTFHAIRPKHVARYLAQFQYRFNRRYQLEEMIPRLAWVALRTPPMPYNLLKLAEVSG